MKSLSESSLKGIEKLKLLVKAYIDENKTDIDALDAFLGILEDKCEEMNTLVNVLDSANDEEYEAEWKAHHYD